MPEGWNREPLGNLVQQDRGITYGVVQPGGFVSEGVPLVRGGDYSNGWVPIENIKRIREEIDRPYRRSKLRGGDLLMTIVGYTGITVEVPAWLTDANITQTTARIAINPERAHPRFCLHALRSESVQDQVRRCTKGAAQPGLNLEDVELFLITCPPLNEQRQIAAVLDTWDEAIAIAERLTSALKRRRADLSRLMFGTSTCTTVVGSIGRLEKGRGLAKADLADTGVPCLRYAEIYTQYGDTARELTSRASAAGALSSRRLLTGEIVLAASGETIEEIGKAVAYLGEEAAVVGGDTVILTGHNQNAAFLAHALNSASLVRQKAAAGKGHSVVHIHAPDIAKLMIPLPPRDTQDQVATLFMHADNEIAERQIAIDLLRRQKRGLMQKLLTGEWRIPATGDAFVPGGPAADRLEAAE